MADGSGIRDLAASKDGRLLVAFGNSNSRVAVFKADAGGIMERDANLNRDCQCVAPAPEGWLAGEDGLLVAGQMGPVVLLNKNWTTGQNSTYLHMVSERPSRIVLTHEQTFHSLHSLHLRVPSKR